MLLLFGGLGFGITLVAVLGIVTYVLHAADSAPALDSLHPRVSGGSSQVFAADGTRLGFIQSDELRTPVAWPEIPTELKHATVAIEDQRFYSNNGVDFTGIVRSAFKDLSSGSALQGGSTITMQLMRNLYLGGDQHSLHQKIVEAKYAIEYTKHHSKRSILTSYLNSVPYGTVGGQTAIGVEAASRIFFDKPVWQLDLEQSALLAGLPQAPSQYNPFLNPRAARERRNQVLAKMAQLHDISDARPRRPSRQGLEVHRGYYYSERRESFFFEYVRQKLLERYGASTVQRGGLKVYTTINLNMQRLARKAIAEVLNEPEDPASAIVTINPANGDIEAMAESESYEKSQYNLAADGHRQPGSTFKAIDLADALSHGIDPNSTYYLSHTLEPGWLPTYPEYEVKTFEGTSLNKPENLVQATVTSDNTVYAQLAADLGEESVTRTAYSMGVRTHLSSYPAEALGGLTLGVTPLEMAVVYATLADGGWRNSPIAITKVVFPDGHVDNNWGTPHRVKALTEAVTGGGDEHPGGQRPERHRHPLGDQLPHRRQDRDHQQTDRRLARRVHAPLLHRGVDGLPEQARGNDRRPRGAPAGRLSAGRNLARVHGGRHRRQALRPVPQLQQAPNYEPFFGKYSLGGYKSGSEYLQPGEEPSQETYKPGPFKTGPTPKPSEGPTATTPTETPPAGSPTAPSSTPPPKQTGGAPAAG